MVKIAQLQHPQLIPADIFILSTNSQQIQISIPDLKKTLSIAELFILDKQNVIVWENLQYKEKLYNYAHSAKIEMTQVSPPPVPVSNYKNETYSEHDPDYPTYDSPNAPFNSQGAQYPVVPNMEGFIPPQEITMPLGQYYNQIAEDLDPAPSAPRPALKVKSTVILWSTLGAGLILIALYFLIKLF